MAKTTLYQISAVRKEQVVQYATASGNLYGAISLNEIVDIFNPLRRNAD